VPNDDAVKRFFAKFSQLTDGYADDDGYMTESFLLNNVNWMTDDPAEFAKKWREEGTLDFVYDFRSGFFFVGMFACHQTVMSELYYGYVKNNNIDRDTAADKYVDEGMGVFRSSQSYKVWHGKNAVIPPGLKYIWRKDLEVL
jgi:hypothetical protein